MDNWWQIKTIIYKTYLEGARNQLAHHWSCALRLFLKGSSPRNHILISVHPAIRWLLKAQPTYFLMTPLLVTSFVWPQKKKTAVSEEKRHCCYCTEEVHNFFLPANGKEWVLISPNSVGNLALTKSQSFLQVLSCQQKGIQISGVLVTVCCSSISFLFKRFFFFFVYF